MDIEGDGYLTKNSRGSGSKRNKRFLHDASESLEGDISVNEYAPSNEDVTEVQRVKDLAEQEYKTIQSIANEINNDELLMVADLLTEATISWEEVNKVIEEINTIILNGDSDNVEFKKKLELLKKSKSNLESKRQEIILTLTKNAVSDSGFGIDDPEEAARILNAHFSAKVSQSPDSGIDIKYHTPDDIIDRNKMSEKQNHEAVTGSTILESNSENFDSLKNKIVEFREEATKRFDDFNRVYKELSKKTQKRQSVAYDKIISIYNDILKTSNISNEDNLEKSLEKLSEVYINFINSCQTLLDEIKKDGVSKVVLPVDVASPAPDKVTKVSVLESGADDNSALPENDLDSRQELDRNYVVQLTEMYKKRDNRVFKVPPGHDGSPFKKIDEVWDELGFILRHEGFTQEQINEFLNNSIARDIRTDISSVNKAFHDNRGDKLDLKNERSAYYERLLAEVANFLVAKSVEGTHTSTEDKAMVEPKEQQESGTLSVSELTELYRGGQWSVFETINSDGTPVYKGIDRIFDEVKLVVEEQDIDRVEKEEILRKVGDIVNEVKRLTSESVLEDDENKREKLSAGVQEELNKLFNLVQNSLQRDNSQDLPNTTTIPTIGKVNIDNKVFVKPHSFENYSVPAVGGDEVFDGAGGVEILDSDILNGPSFYEQLGDFANESEGEGANTEYENEKLRLAEYFERWKNADETMFEERWLALGDIRKDVGTILYLAGYNEDERRSHYMTRINPVFRSISDKRKEYRDTKDPKKLESILEERKALLKIMSELLHGREIDPVLLDKVEIKSEEQTSEEILSNIEEIKHEYEDAVTYLTEHGEGSNSALVEVGKTLKLIDDITETDPNIVLNKKRKYLKNLNVKMEELRKVVNSVKKTPDATVDKPKVNTEEARKEDFDKQESKEKNDEFEIIKKKVDSLARYYTDLVSALSLLGLNHGSAFAQARQLAESIYFDVEQASSVEEKQEKIRAFQNALLEAAKVKSKGESGEIEDDWIIVRVQGDKVLLFKQVGDQTFNNSVLISEFKNFNSEAVAPDESTSSVENRNLESEYSEAKSSLRKKNEDGTEGMLFKSEYRNAKKTYDEALKNHYKELGERTKFGSAVDGLFKKLGIRSEFPPELVALEKDYKEKRKEYAVKLDQALTARARVRGGTEDGGNEPWYKPGSAKAKMAFGQKFVLRPHAEQLKLHEDYVLSEEQKSLMRKIMPALARNKHLIRAGSVAASSILGFATGGAVTALAFGGLKIGRMLAGMVVGTYAARSVHELTQIGVNAAERKIEQKQDDIQDKFDVNDLDSLEEALLTAESEKQDRIKIQKRLTVAAAMAGGFSTGAYDHDSVTGYWGDAIKGNGGEIPNPEAVPGVVKTEVESGSGTATESISKPAGGPSVSAVEQVTKIEHIVKPGDNVSTIFHKNLVDQFDLKNLKLPEGVTRGELSKMMYSKFPELTDAKNPNWTLSPQEWKDLGVGSGNPALIRPGENIDVAKLLEKFADPEVKPGQSGVKISTDIPVRPRTGALPITADSGERVVPINYTPVRPDEFGIPNVNDIPPQTPYYDTSDIGYDGEELPKAEVPPVTEPQYPPSHS
ncbi:MAG: hypothetical protein R3B53_04565 [Candidatus Paceibacterota bacterium]